jgi:hypothetical protein
MRARMMLVLAMGMACGVNAAARGEPVFRLTGPQQPVPDGTEPFDHFSDIVNSGVVFGSINEASLTESELIRVEPDGSVHPLVFSGPPTQGVWEITGDGVWGIGDAGFEYGPGECSLEFGGSAGRYVRVDLASGVTSYLTALCPTFDAFGISGDGGTVVGRQSRNDWPHSFDDGEFVWSITDAALWRGGEIVVLELPAFPEPSVVDVGSIARAVSSDGRVIVGSVYPPLQMSVEPPFGEAIRWIDGVPEILPHFPSTGAEAQTSLALGISADGSAVYGRTIDWAFGGVNWDWIERTSWISRNGELTDLGLPDQNNHVLQGITGDGSLLFGGEFPNLVADWRGIVWSEANGLESADAWLARLGVDLEGQAVRQVIDISDNGHWMLVTLRVDDTAEQYARISVPCSPADVTADRSITIDDAAAYAERFSDGHALADLTGDGLLDLADIVRYLGLFAEGCPG